jgi:Tfp pilus assembly protein PilV
MITRNKLGLSLLEIVIAIFFMSIAILSFFTMNQASNRSSMDAYYEFLAFSLAKEPIEVFRGFNYDYLSAIVFQGAAPPSIYPTDGNFHDITFDPTIDMQYPSESTLFQRKIELSAVSGSILKGIKIKTTVAVKGSSRAEAWMSNKAVELEAVIMERPK